MSLHESRRETMKEEDGDQKKGDGKGKEGKRQ